MQLTHMQCNVNADAGRPAGVVKNFNVGYISLNIRGRLLIFAIHIRDGIYYRRSITITITITLKF